MSFRHLRKPRTGTRPPKKDGILRRAFSSQEILQPILFPWSGGIRHLYARA